MFGYVRPYKPELKVKEYEMFRAAYCGLCWALKEKYGILLCTAEELKALPDGAVVGRKESAYGVEAMVRRDAVPDRELLPVELEQLFIYMVKEAER